MNKKIIILSMMLALCVLFIVGCAKEIPNNGNNNSSVSKIQQKPADLKDTISDENLTMAKEFFSKNNLNIDNYKITYFTFDKTPNPDTHHYLVKTIRIYKGMQIFSGGDVNYQFNTAGLKVYESGCVLGTCEVSPQLSTVPNISKEEALDIARAERPGLFDKGPLFAELGIANAKVGMGYHSPDFVLTWKITIGDSKYPVAFINAADGKIVYIDDGMRTAI
jgi:hypothetical protein